MLALGDLLRTPALLADGEPRPGEPLAPRAPHFTPRAKAVIWLFMEGAPSAVDLFDPKPELDKTTASGSRSMSSTATPAP